MSDTTPAAAADYNRERYPAESIEAGKIYETFGGNRLEVIEIIDSPDPLCAVRREVVYRFVGGKGGSLRCSIVAFVSGIAGEWRGSNAACDPH